MRNLLLSQFYVNPTKAQFVLIITSSLKHIFILYLLKNVIFESDDKAFFQEGIESGEYPFIKTNVQHEFSVALGFL